MDLDEGLAGLPEQGNADRSIVDEGAGAAVGAESAAQDQGVVKTVQPVFGKDTARRVIGTDFEFRGNACLLGAMAHERAVGAHAKRQAQGIEEN